MEPLIKKTINYLHENRPFLKSLFDYSGDPDLAGIERDKRTYYETSSVCEVLKIIEELEQQNRGQRRIIGLRANIQDGKTTFLKYLKFDNRRDFLPILITNKEEDKWKLISWMVHLMFYEMRQANILSESDYNTATVDLKKSRIGELSIETTIKQYLHKFRDHLTGKILFLCDDADSKIYLDAFLTLIELTNDEPPVVRFFNDALFVVVFCTREREIEETWHNENLSASGHRFQKLSITIEDMLNIVRQIFEVSYESLEENNQELKDILKENSVFPFEENGLMEIIKNKAEIKTIENNQHNYRSQVTEIQLYNMLNLLQRVIDERIKENMEGLITATDILRVDNTLRIKTSVSS